MKHLLTSHIAAERNIFVSLNLLLIASLLLFSCKKQSDEQEQGEVEINFSISNLKSESIANSDAASASTLAYIVVSIEDLNGKVIKNAEKIDIYNMNESYISKPLPLTKGNYKLTQFLVLDWQNNVVYSSPTKGSAKAYLVNAPLPLTFTVQTNVVTKITPEVLNVAGCKPEDFGYTTFSFDIAQTFDFLVGTFVYNDKIKNYKLSPSSISIYTNVNSLYSGQLEGTSSNIFINIYDSIGVTNRITLPESQNTFTLKISKTGYKTYSQFFTKEELKLHLRSVDKGPLVVLLEKIPDPSDDTVTDIDGNVYHTVTIGSQVWMVENLKTTRNNDGTAIHHVTSDTEWTLLTTPAYCWYNNDLSNKNPYGALYNWYAVNTGKLAPTGWHVPSDAEFAILSSYLGGESVSGGKLKELGTTHWASPNLGATNEFGFTALPGGYRAENGEFIYIGRGGNWWSSSQHAYENSWYVGISYEYIGTGRGADLKGRGFSVRCVKD